VTNCKGAGVALAGMKDASTTDTVAAENTLNGNGFHGIQADCWYDAVPITGIVVAYNVCSGNTNSGIYAVKARNWTIVGNEANDNDTARGGGSAGVFVAQASGIFVASNTTRDTRTGTARTQGRGVSVAAWNATWNVSGIDMVYNETSNNWLSGLVVENMSNDGTTGLIDWVRVVGNASNGNGQYGLFAWQVKPGTITNAVVSENTYDGNGLLATRINLT
jgi:parallel beta-helix repeat protein